MSPTPLFAMGVALGIVPILFGILGAEAIVVAILWNGVLVVLLGVDFIRTPHPRDLEVRREVADILSLATSAQVTLALDWHGERVAHLEFVDAPPSEMTADGHRAAVRMAPRSRQRITYRVTPHQRGEAAFGDLYLRFNGPLRLARRRHRVPLHQLVKVYPDLQHLVANTQALLRELAAGSIRGPRRAVGGREFDSLRDYSTGDDIRLIDWKATARRGHPIARQYRPEQNQDVVLMIDCGRHMRPRIGNYTKLDFVVNTVVTLSHVALLRGDQVGLVVFDHEVKTYLPPRKGRDQLLRIVDALFHVQPTLTESDYHAAYDALGRRALRRSLIVTFTDLLDEDSSRVLLARTFILRRRHLPLIVSVADSDLLETARRVPTTRDDAYRRLAAGRMVRDHEATTHRLQAGGALVVNVPAAQLSSATLGRYLEIKARGQL